MDSNWLIKDRAEHLYLETRGGKCYSGKTVTAIMSLSHLMLSDSKVKMATTELTPAVSKTSVCVVHPFSHSSDHP